MALIDDDELPGPRWLLDLVLAAHRLAVDGVLAPVLPRYEQPPPAWVLKGRFFDRPAPATGEVLQWTQTRSGNALLRRAVFERSPDWFDPAFGSGGEDRDFFRRKITQGHVFAWTNDAAVHEWVPPGRWDRRVLLKRALLRGRMSAARGRQHSAQRVEVGAGGAGLWAGAAGRSTAGPPRADAGPHSDLRPPRQAAGVPAPDPRAGTLRPGLRTSQAMSASPAPLAVATGHGDLMLVTGANGYLGAIVVRKLLQAGHQRVRCLVRSLPARRLASATQGNFGTGRR